MNNTHPSIIAQAAILSLGLAVTALCQTPVPVTNAGFESPTQTNGNYTASATGWTVIGSAESGVWNPAASNFSAEAPEGQNVGYVYGGPADSGHAQVLSGATGLFQADANYSLSVKVGNSITYPFDGYRVQLLAGGTLLAEDNNTLAPAVDSFVTSMVNYTYNAADAALVGQPLEIRLLGKAQSGGTVGETEFDDVQLTVTLTNPVANAGGPYAVAISSGSLSLNGSGSLPSAGETITTYEWDLDNNGTFGDVTGATPAAIPYATLTGTYGMVAGANTIKLKVTDSAAKTSTVSGTVTLFVPTATYIGTNTSNADRWNTSTNWNPDAVPTGGIDVIVPSGKLATAWSASTPTYTGNLSIGANAQVAIGWTTVFLQSYNALGTPGQTTISMAEGASINMRMGGSPSIPAIQLLGNASLTLSSSTQPNSTATFARGINGPHTFTLLGKSGCVANLTTVANSFKELVADAQYGNNFTINANFAGCLGGDVTIRAASNGVITANLVIGAADAMADTATLTLNGPASATKLRMNAADTIAKLVVDGVQQPAGVYGKIGSGAQYEVSWMHSASTAVLTVIGAPSIYWDINGATAGAGGASPAGTWDLNTTPNWNLSADGTGIASFWSASAGQTAVFAAGMDATGTYGVTVSGTQAIGGVGFEEGTVTLSGGTLEMTSDSLTSVAPGLSATIASTISNDATPRRLAKGGAGELVLSGANTYTGVTRIEGGTLTVASLAGSGVDSPLGNYPSAGPGGLRLVGGTLRYTGGSAAIDRGLTLSGNSTLDLSAPGTALTLGNCDSSDAPGTLTVTGGAGSSLILGQVRIVEGAGMTLNPTGGSITVASALGYTSYPNSSTLTLGGTTTGNVITGSLSVQNPPGSGFTQTIPVVKSGSSEWAILGGVGGGGSTMTVNGGTLTLSGANSYTGTTAVQTGTLIAGTNSPSNVNGAFGKAVSEVTFGVANGSTNASILTGGAFNVGRNIRLLTQNGTDTGTRILTLGGNTADESVFSGALHLGSNNNSSRGVRLSAVNGGKVTFSGVIQNPTGMDASETSAASALTAVTKVGAGTVVLAGANTYLGSTLVSEGTLLINNTSGFGTSSGTVNVNGGTLGGTGLIGGSVLVAADGNLAPGASAGTLSVGGGLDISAQAAGAGKLAFELDALAGTNDLIAVTGTLTIGSGALGFNDFAFTNLGGLEAGTYTLITSGGVDGTLDGANLSGAIGAFTGTLQATSTALQLVVTNGGGGNTFADWIAGFPGAAGDTSFGGDPDGDGTGSGLENFFGTDPGVFTAGLVAGVVSGNTFTFTHPQNATPAGDVSAPAYTWSTDLSSFTANGAASGGTTVTLSAAPNNPIPGTTTVTATITGTPVTRLFVRVAVTQVVP